jgi:hypothetical protein
LFADLAAPVVSALRPFGLKFAPPGLIFLALALVHLAGSPKALADAPVTYREIAEAQSLWQTVEGQFDLIKVRFLIKSGPGFSAGARYWVSVDGTRIDLPVDRFGQFTLPALSAEQAKLASVETDDTAGPVRLETDIIVRYDNLPSEYARIVRAAGQIDKFAGLLADKALGGAAFLVKGFIPSVRNLDFTFEPERDICELVLTYKDGDATKIPAKAGAAARLALKPVYGRENPMISTTCAVRTIKPASDKPQQDAPKYKDLAERQERCAKVEARYDRVVCAPILKSKGPNKPQGQITVEEAGQESDITGDNGPIDLWVTHNGERVAIKMADTGQFLLPDRPDLLAANPTIESSLNANYLQPSFTIGPTRPPKRLTQNDVLISLSQTDGMVSVLLGPVLAAIVPSFDRVEITLEQIKPDCALVIADQNLPQSGIEPVRLDKDTMAKSPDTEITLTCPLKGYRLIATTLLADIAIADKGFRYHRREGWVK